MGVCQPGDKGHSRWTNDRYLWEQAARSPRRGALPSPLHSVGRKKSGLGSRQKARKVAVRAWPETMLRGTAPGVELEAELAAAEGSLGVSGGQARGITEGGQS